jgi:hypothetical protein
MRRIVNVLRTHVVANERTLEQKISDAGPNNQRAEPHILTIALRELQLRGDVMSRTIERTPWYYLNQTPIEDVEQRLAELMPIYDATQEGSFLIRLGQTLEIAVYKTLLRHETRQQFFGHFTDLDKHADDLSYTKIDPPQMVGRRTLSRGRLDFVVFGNGGPAGIEAKNYRMWLYPDREQIRELLRKCCEIDVVPVLIARRFPYLTFQLLRYCGAIVHQTYNQLYFNFDRVLGEQARNKTLLGYHDIRFGTDPDSRLDAFLGRHLPAVLPDARRRFQSLKELHDEYARGVISYREWKRQVLSREGLADDEEEPPEGSSNQG